MRIIAAALVLGCGVTAWAVQLGDTRASVIAELGEPQTKAAAGSREFLNYPAGRVEITHGRVSDIRGSFRSATEPPPVVTPSPPVVTAAPTTPIAAATPGPVRPQTGRWYTDIAEVQAAAVREKKLILALFTGTDWCPPCRQFKEEVENDAQFAGIFSPSFVFFKSDWLRNTPQPGAVADEVGRLKRKYWIRSYPTLLVLNAEGEKLAKVEWTKVQGGSFKEVMIEAIDEARKATKGGKKVSDGWWPF